MALNWIAPDSQASRRWPQHRRRRRRTIPPRMSACWSVRGSRSDQCDRPAHRAEARRALRPSILYRERAGRRRQHRHGAGRQGSGQRLHRFSSSARASWSTQDLYAKVPYDPVNEFAPITLIAASPNVLVVHPDVPAKSVKELIALIKASPGKYSYAQPALGSTPHLGGELFKLTFNLDLAMVPFPGAAPAITSTIGGHTPIAFTALPPAITAAKENKVRALAVMAEKRVGALPDVPTMAEAGVADQEADAPDRNRRARRHAERNRRSASARHRQDRRPAGHQGEARRARLPAPSPTRRRSSPRRSRPRWKNGARWCGPPS